jgi:hypothetical protein
VLAWAAMRPSLLLLTSALILGCGDDCTDTGCGTTFLVELASQGYRDGEYEIAVEAGDDSTTCTFTIEGGAATASPCEPAIALVDTSELEDGFVLVRFESARPRQLTVSVARDGEELASEKFEPEYEEVDASLDVCGSTCTAAQVSLEVPGRAEP